MIAISLKLPDDLAEASTKLADQIGITRTELIRRALRHELERIQRQQEQTAMAASFRAMGKSDTYLEETRLLDEGFAERFTEIADDHDDRH
jgi:predicted transcriptional regulator